jgi:hypothetical protein
VLRNGARALLAHHIGLISVAAVETKRDTPHQIQPIRIWSNLPQEVQNRLFQKAVTSHGETIRLPLAVFLHDKYPRTSGPLGNPREMMEPDSLGG